MHLEVLIWLLLTLLELTSAKKYSKANDAVLLSKVRTLTLQGDKQTSHRRVKSIPQLKCVGGSGKGHYDVDVMRCKNSGSEYDTEDIQWTCQASLPPEFKLGGTEVVCEGYDGPNDPYILKGSCGVEYRLILTELGEERYGGKWFGQKSKSSRSYDKSTKTGGGDLLNTLWTVVFWAIFIGIVGIILYRVFYPNQPVRLPNAGRYGRGGGGGGGGGDDNDPPPPYTPRAPPKAKTQSSSRQSNTSRSSASRSNNSGPGFWSGAGTGGAAGYAAGYYMGNREREQRERARQQGGSSWFGGGGGSSSFGGGADGGSSQAGPSSSRHESTGFGGTRRR